MKNDYQLTARQQEAAALLGAGINHKQAALRMGISRNTMYNHTRAIFHKLAIQSVVHLAHYALEAGLCPNKFAK